MFISSLEYHPHTALALLSLIIDELVNEDEFKTVKEDFQIHTSALKVSTERSHIMVNYLHKKAHEVT